MITIHFCSFDFRYGKVGEMDQWLTEQQVEIKENINLVDPVPEIKFDWMPIHTLYIQNCNLKHFL